jgi:hypothetical protein
MQFPLELLYLPCLVIFFSCLLISFEVTRSVSFSVSASLIKAGIFIIYFGVLFDGSFTFLDDWSYLDLGVEMYYQRIDILDLITNDDAEMLQSISGGEHYGYSLYNAYAFRLFGFGYYAPVAMNIVLTVLIAWLGAHLASVEFRINGVWKKLFFTFLLFHPDIFAWSNIMNGKDTLILLLHVLLLYSISLYFRTHILSGLILAFVVSAILSTLRFYVPLLFGTALGISLLLMTAKKSSNVLQIIVVMIAAGFIYFTDDYFKIAENIDSLQGDYINPVYGFVHFLFTPIPFNTSPEYKFLDIPALIHWLLMPFAILGFLTIAKASSGYDRFFIVYVLIFLALYSCYGELQGPRHRVQIDYAWAVLQFTGIKPYLRRAFM